MAGLQVRSDAVLTEIVNTAAIRMASPAAVMPTCSAQTLIGRHEGQADAISPAVGEDARGPQGHDEGLRDGSRLVRVHSGLVRTGDRG